MKKISACICVSLCLFLSPVSQSNQISTQQVYHRIDVNEVYALLIGMDIKSRIRKDQIGYPMFDFSLGGYHTQLYTYDCEETGCAGLQLRTGFTMEFATTLAEINRWNAGATWARVYIDGYGDPVVEADLALTGGVSASAIKSWLSRYRVGVANFAQHINFE